MTETESRKTALVLLNALDRGHVTLDRLLTEQFQNRISRMSQRDIHLSYALIYGVLRWRGRLDWIIGRFSKQRITKVDPPVLNILRIGVFQIFHLNRIPDSAAVNTAVELAKTTSPSWVVRFVNGLLRNVVRSKDRIEWPDPDANPLLWLSVDQSFPEWLIRRWVDRFGYDQARQLCEYVNSIAPLTLRANTLKVSRDELVDMLKPSVTEPLTVTPYAPEGICLHGRAGAVEELPGYSEGYFQVQDEAAQLVAHCLAPKTGETILDACSGLGGKTGHIAQLMGNDGRLTATDHDSRKLEALDAEMKRLGITCVTTRVHDLNQSLDPSVFPLYDRILVDAPCSGLGVIRRNPDTKWSADPNAFARYGKRQLRYLDSASGRLKPGGILLYAVCSMAPEETDDVVSAFIKMHPDFTIDKSPRLTERLGSLVDDRGLIRSFPHRHQMDGFFIARLRKKT